MEESGVAPGFNCRNLGVPLRPLCYQAVVLCLHLAWSMQPSLKVSQAATFLMLQEGKSKKYQSTIPPGLHTATPRGPAAGGGPVLHAAVTIPLSGSGTFPMCHLSVQDSFPWRAPVPCLEKACIIFSSYSSEPLPPVEHWKTYCLKTWFSWEDLKEQYCSYTKSCPESWKV